MEDSTAGESHGESESDDTTLDALLASYVDRLNRGEMLDGEMIQREHPAEAREILERLEALGDWASRGTQPGTPGDAELPGENGGRRYEHQGEVARGGMGVIYKVEDRDLKRTIAMKVMLRAPDEETKAAARPAPHLLARFLEEAQVTAQLDHPGIAPVYELGFQSEGQPYFTMKLVKGRQLGEVLRLAREEREGWNLPRVVGVMVKACQAVAFAHAKGVIHRDLKPSNVMVGRFGEVYVMDWGLAKVRGKDDLHDIRLKPDSQITYTTVRSERRRSQEESSESPLITQDGTVVGTPACMPPEQAKGLVEEVDHVSDVYSLGAILYNLLTGQAPYVEPAARLSPHTILAAVTQGPPKPVHELSPEASPELAAICERAMAREKSDRYASSLELAEDLQAYLDHRVVQAYRTGPVAELKAWVARNKGTAVAVAAAAVTFTAGLLAVVLIQHDRNIHVTRSMETATIAKAAAEAERDAARRNLYRSLVREARMIRLARRAGYRKEVWARLKEASVLETPERSVAELRGEAVACLGDFVGLEREVWSDAHSARIVVDPQGRRVGLSLPDGTTSIRELSTGKEIEQVEGRVVFTPEAMHSLRVDHEPGQGHPRVFQTVQIRTSDGKGEWGKAVSADLGAPHFILDSDFGARAVFRLRDDPTVVSVWDIRERSEVARFRCPHRVTGGHVTQDGRFVVVTFREETKQETNEETGEEPSSEGDERSRKSGFVVWSIESGETVATRDLSPDRYVYPMHSSADGELFVVQGPATVYKTENFETVIRVPAWAGDTKVALSPKGRLLAIASSQQNLVRLWDVALNRQIAALSCPSPADLEFSVDGRSLIASPRGAVYVWRLGGTPETLKISGHGLGVTAVAFSSDGKWLASTGKERTVKIWEASTGRLLRTLEGLPGAGQTVAFSPDGRLLAAGDYNEGFVGIWELSSGERLLELAHDCGSTIWSVAFSPDGRLFAAGGQGGLGIWRLEKAGAREAQAPIRLEPVVQRPGVIWHVRFSPDGRRLAVDDGRPGWSSRCEIWDLEQSKVVVSPAGWVADLHSSVWFFPDSRRVVFRNRHWLAEVWDVEADRRVRLLDAGGSRADVVTEGMGKMQLSPDGRKLAATSYSLSGTNVWELETGALLAALPEKDSSVWCLAWSPGSERLAVSRSSGDVAIWDLESIRLQLSQLGLDLAESEESPVERAVKFLEPLVEELGYSAKLIDALGAEDPLEPEVHDLAVRVANTERDRAWILNADSRERLREDGLTPEVYQEGLQLAEGACRLDPRNPDYLATLAVAHYPTSSESTTFSNVDRILELFDRVQDRQMGVVWEPEKVARLVPRRSDWRYFDRGEYPGKRWSELVYDDRAWREGPAPLGYGEDWLSTTIGFGEDANNKHLTTYFRKVFEVVRPERFAALKIRLLRDDGAAVYINGVQVVRDNLAEGAGRDDQSIDLAWSGERMVYRLFTVAADDLKNGENTVAVEVHQKSRDSSDLIFDLALEGLLKDGAEP